MTTATDWDVRDRETNDELSVTDVQAALNLDGAATEVEPVDVHGLAEALARQTRQTDMLAAENAELRRRLGGWEPRRDPDTITSAADLTEREYNAGLYRPAELDDTDGEGMPLHPIGSSTTWPTWLGGLHHADATLAEQIGGLRSWADTYAAPPVERTVVEPVEIDYSYRQTEAALWAQTVVSLSEQHDPGVYGELAPEALEQALVPTGAPERHDPPRRDPEPDDRVQRMTRRSQEQWDRRRRALLDGPVPDDPDAAAADLNRRLRSGDESQPETPSQTRAGGWLRRRSEWLIAAGVFVAWAGAIGITIWLTGGP